MLRSAKGAARATKQAKNLPAPHSVLREFLKSAKGAARATKPAKNLPAPHSVLREFLRSAKGAARTTKPAKNLPAPHSVLPEFLRTDRAAFTTTNRHRPGISSCKWFVNSKNCWIRSGSLRLPQVRIPMSACDQSKRPLAFSRCF